MTPAKEGSNGSKATIREVYEIVKPLGEGQARIETKLEEFIKHYDVNHKILADDLKVTISTNTEAHENIIKTIGGKISTKAFTVWISITVTILTIIILVLEKVIG